jgi:hypothetical protein
MSCADADVEKRSTRGLQTLKEVSHINSSIRCLSATSNRFQNGNEPRTSDQPDERTRVEPKHDRFANRVSYSVRIQDKSES